MWVFILLSVCVCVCVCVCVSVRLVKPFKWGQHTSPLVSFLCFKFHFCFAVEENDVNDENIINEYASQMWTHKCGKQAHEMGDWKQASNVSILQTWAYFKREYISNVSILQTSVYFKREHTSNVSILQTWAYFKREYTSNVSILRWIRLECYWEPPGSDITELCLSFGAVYPLWHVPLLRVNECCEKVGHSHLISLTRGWRGIPTAFWSIFHSSIFYSSICLQM